MRRTPCPESSLRWRSIAALAASVVALVGCATTETPPGSGHARLGAAEGRALVGRLLPDGLADRAGWATDIYATLSALDVRSSPENICAAVAMIEQESGFRVDPPVPGLSRIAWKEIETRRERAGVPKVLLDAALALPSSNGRSYGERIDAVRTELQLSDLYEDFIGRVPLGRTFFADRNPVRTGGPMQVSVGFAEAFVEARPYPYPVTGSVRHEVFTRRGGVYFGIAHLLDYPAPYDRPLFRFADFNAGHYASRNAAFQSAVTQVSGIPLAQDGDLLRYEGGRPAAEPGDTELAARVLARRIRLTDAEVRRDLERGKGEGFERTPLYSAVFEMADRVGRKPAPRAVIPDILLQSPKITRKLTTDWFARRVDARYSQCLRRAGA